MSERARTSFKRFCHCIRCIDHLLTGSLRAAWRAKRVFGIESTVLCKEVIVKYPSIEPTRRGACQHAANANQS